MSNEIVALVLFVVVIGLVLFFKGSDKNIRTVLNGPSRQDKEKQRSVFAKMTVPEIKKYIQSKGKSGRLPTKKAELIDIALHLWSKG